MWVWAPTSLPVIPPFSPRVTSTRHSGIPIPRRPYTRVSAWDTRLDSTLSRCGRKSSSLSSTASAGAEAACATPSRTGPEFIIDRAPGVERSIGASTAGEHRPKISSRATAHAVWRPPPPSDRVLAQAFDGDELVLGRGAGGGRHAAADLVALDLAERRGAGEVVRLGIGGGHHDAASRAGGEAAVDAIAVRDVGDDECARFGLRSRAEGGARQDERGEDRTHRWPPSHPGFPGDRNTPPHLAWKALRRP